MYLNSSVLSLFLSEHLVKTGDVFKVGSCFSLFYSSATLISASVVTVFGSGTSPGNSLLKISTRVDADKASSILAFSMEFYASAPFFVVPPVAPFKNVITSASILDAPAAYSLTNLS